MGNQGVGDAVINLGRKIDQQLYRVYQNRKYGSEVFQVPGSVIGGQ